MAITFWRPTPSPRAWTSSAATHAPINPHRSVFRWATLLFGLICLAGAAQAQSPASPGGARGQREIGETVADRPSTRYRFEKHTFDSADGKRHYRVELAIPMAPAPEAGYAALYMLDGNAAMATLTDEDLAALAHTHPPVLVAIGYDVVTRNDVVSRAYDYTPPAHAPTPLATAPIVRGRAGGGADEFMALIASRIKPLVQTRAHVDPARAYLWGHSYGGLFALHVLFTQPDAFARYIVGDPSAWWNEGALIHTWHAFAPQRAAGKRIAILVGTKPRDGGRPAPTPPASQPAAATPVDPRAAVAEMAAGLRAGGADVHYESFPQYGHGDMIRVSLERALRLAVAP